MTGLNIPTAERAGQARSRQLEEPSPRAPQPNDPAAFVENLDIEILGSGRLWRSGENAGLSDSLAPQPASANVDAASVVTFVDGLSGQQKEDVLNSTLLAQLAANRKHDRERDTPSWYDMYRTVLEKVGWTSRPPGKSDRAFPVRGLQMQPGARPGPLLPSSPGSQPGTLPVFTLPFNRVVTTQPRFTPEAAVLELIKPIASQAQVALTRTTLDVFRSLPDRDRRVIIFETSSHTSGSGNFQILSVTLSKKQVVEMTIAAYFFRSDEPVTRLLSFNFGQRSTQMFQASHVMTLNDDAYSKTRARVIDQLGDQASAYIDDLPV